MWRSSRRRCRRSFVDSLVDTLCQNQRNQTKSNETNETPETAYTAAGRHAARGPLDPQVHLPMDLSNCEKPQVFAVLEAEVHVARGSRSVCFCQPRSHWRSGSVIKEIGGPRGSKRIASPFPRRDLLAYFDCVHLRGLVGIFDSSAKDYGIQDANFVVRVFVITGRQYPNGGEEWQENGGRQTPAMRNT
jgi:hypothetical protein